MEAAPEPTEEMVRQMEQLGKKLQQFSENAETLSKRLEERAEQWKLYEVEEPYLEMLRKMGDQLQAQSESASQPAGQPDIDHRGVDLGVQAFTR